MSGQSAESPNLTASQLLSALVHNGLGLYASQIPSTDSPALSALKQRPVIKTLHENPKLNWPQLCESVISNIMTNESPMAQLIGDLKLSASDLFLIGLVGGTDQSTTLALAMRELQQPMQSHHPSVQLCVEIVRTLFNEYDLSIPKLLHNRLFTTNILMLDSGSSLAERHVRIDPFLWSTLSGSRSFGPGCKIIKPEIHNVLAAENLDEVPQVVNAININNKQIVHIEGLPGSGRHDMAAAIAQGIAKQAVLIPYETWEKQPSIGYNCRFANCLPVISVTDASDQTLPMHLAEYANTALIVVTPPNTRIKLPNSIKITTVCDNAEQRHELCKSLLDNRIVAKKLGQHSILSNKLIRMIAHHANLFARMRGEQVQSQDIFRARCQLANAYMESAAYYEAPIAELSAFVAPSENITAMRFCEELVGRRGSFTRGLGAVAGDQSETGLQIALLGASGSGKKTFAKYLSHTFITPLYIVKKSTLYDVEALQLLLEQAAVHDVILYFDQCPSALFVQDGNSLDQHWQRILELLTLYQGVCLFAGNNTIWQHHHAVKVSTFDMVINMAVPDVDTREQLWLYHLGSRAPKKTYCRWLAEEFPAYPGTIRNACKIAGGFTDKKRINDDDLLAALKLELSRFPHLVGDGAGSPPPAELPLNGEPASNHLVQNDSSRH